MIVCLLSITFAFVLASLAEARAQETADTAGCDMDGDGYDALVCGGTDCNDGDAQTYPGAEEIVDDGLDQDCDGYDATTAAWTGGGGSCSSQGAGGAGGVFLVGIAIFARRRRC